MYVGFLVEKNSKSNTIKSYISAIKAVLEEDGVILSADKYLLSSLTKACKYRNDRVTTRLPIHKKLLYLILAALEELLEDQPYLYKLYLALFTSSYYGMLRIGEVLTGDHPVKAWDVHLADNKKKLLFILRTSKTHWTDSHPQLIKIIGTLLLNVPLSLESQKFCPFEAVREYIRIQPKIRSVVSKPFFVFSDRTPVKAAHVRKLLKDSIDRINLDSSLYEFHGICAGRALDLQAQGISIPVLARLGQWKSNAIYAYLSQF